MREREIERENCGKSDRRANLETETVRERERERVSETERERERERQRSSERMGTKQALYGAEVIITLNITLVVMEFS